MKQFAATNIEIIAEEDSFDRGVIGKPQCREFKEINITADSLPELIDRLCETYALDVPSSVFFSDGTISIDQLQGEDGEELTGDEYQLWRDGGCRGWVVTYCFTIELREVREITEDDMISEQVCMH